MLFAFVAPYLFLAFLVALIAFCFLILAARRRFDRWSALLLVLALPALLLAAVPGWLMLRVYLSLWFGHDG